MSGWDADAIGDLRRRYGLSQAALARLLGVDPHTVGRWELGRSVPHPTMRARLAAIARDGIESATGAAAPAPAGLPGMLGPSGLSGLPAHRGATVGRDHDLALLRRLAAIHPLVTLVGPGGVGKTRLAVEVVDGSRGNPARVGLGGVGTARRADEPVRAPQGDPLHQARAVWFVDLAAARDRDTVIATLARRLDVTATRTDDALERIVGFAAVNQPCLVLDNCEQAREAIAAVAAAIVAAAPEARLLATSRVALGIDTETVYEVGPLASADAAELFARRADERRGAGTGRAADISPAADIGHAVVVELCQRLDRLPLAIELAAARSHVLSASQMIDRLDRRFELLRGTTDGLHNERADEGPEGRPDRQRSLDAAIAWSYELLASSEAALFRACGAFAGRFDLAALTAVAVDPTTSELDVVDGIDHLVSHSLVVAEHGGEDSTVRYRLLDSLAAFAARELARADPDGVVARRHAVYHAALALDAAHRLSSPDHTAALALLDDRYADITAALATMIDTGDGDAACELVGALRSYWRRSARYAEGLRWAERALAASAGGRAQESDGARVRDSDGARARDSAGERAGVAGGAPVRAAASERARRAGGRSADGSTPTTVQSTPARVQATVTLVALLGAVGRAAEAEALGAEVARLAVVIGDRGGEADALAQLGLLYNRRNDTAAAERAYAAARACAEQLDDRARTTAAEVGLGNAAGLRGGYVEAAEHYHAALALARTSGDRASEAMVLSNLAELAAHSGDADAGLQYTDAALAVFEAIGHRDAAATTLGNSAELAAISGDYAAAVARSASSVARLRAAGYRLALGNMLWVHGLALAGTGRHREALACLREAVEIDFGRANLPDVAAHFDALARLHAEAGDGVLAARLLGAAARIRDETGAVAYALFDLAGTVAAARRRLGDDDYERVRHAGFEQPTLMMVHEANHLGEVADGRPIRMWKALGSSAGRAVPTERAVLTDRQVEVLRLVAAGLSNHDVGRQLGISARTVERHLRMSFVALGVDRRSAAVAAASALGVLSR